MTTLSVTERAGSVIVRFTGVRWTLTAAQAVELQNSLLDILEGDSQFPTLPIGVNVPTRDGDRFAILTFDQAAALEAALDKWLNEGPRYGSD